MATRDRMRGMIQRLRILSNAALAERIDMIERKHKALLTQLNFCEDCRTVLFGDEGITQIKFEKNDGSEPETKGFCRFCAQKYISRKVVKFNRKGRAQ